VAISDQEKQYFNAGINAVCKDIDIRIRAANCLNKDSLADVLSCVNFWKNAFVASASAAGVVTPNSVALLSSVDITAMQVYTGYMPDASNGVSLANNVTALKDQAGNTTITGFQTNTLTDAVMQLQGEVTALAGVSGNTSIIGFVIDAVTAATMQMQSEILTLSAVTETNTTVLQDRATATESDVTALQTRLGAAETNIESLQASSAATAAVIGTPQFYGTPLTVTSCFFNNDNVMVLGNVIAQGSKSVLGVLKAQSDCDVWVKNIDNADWWYTQTGNVADCQMPPLELVWEFCVGATNVSLI